MNDNKEDGNYRTDCGSALPSCVLAEIKFSLLQHCRWSMLYIGRAIGVRRDKCNTPSTPVNILYTSDCSATIHISKTRKSQANKKNSLHIY